MARTLQIVVFSACLGALCLAADPKPRIAMQVAMRPGVPSTVAQQWSKTLADAGLAGVQIRSGTARDEVSVTADRGGYQVVGVLASDNTLQLPGGRFSTGDVARLRTWIDTLTELGPEGVTQKPVAFGLHAAHLEAIYADLRQPVKISTADANTRRAIDSIAASLQYPLVMEAATARALADLNVADELQGLSSGTALAALLRPAGLAFVPQRQSGGKFQYLVVKPQAGARKLARWLAAKAAPQPGAARDVRDTECGNQRDAVVGSAASDLHAVESFLSLRPQRAGQARH